MARLGDGGWNPVVEQLIAASEHGAAIDLDDQMLAAIAGVLKRWNWAARPTWICPMPSRRRQSLIDAIAEGLGTLGKLPVHRVLIGVASSEAPAGSFQQDQANSAHQVANVWHRFSIDPEALPATAVLDGPVLLIDDEVDSRWTMTVAGHLLAGHGSGQVLPFALRAR